MTVSSLILLGVATGYLAYFWFNRKSQKASDEWTRRGQEASIRSTYFSIDKSAFIGPIAVFGIGAGGGIWVASYLDRTRNLKLMAEANRLKKEIDRKLRLAWELDDFRKSVAVKSGDSGGLLSAAERTIQNVFDSIGLGDARYLTDAVLTPLAFLVGASTAQKHIKAYAPSGGTLFWNQSPHFNELLEFSPLVNRSFAHMVEQSRMGVNKNKKRKKDYTLEEIFSQIKDQRDKSKGTE